MFHVYQYENSGMAVHKSKWQDFKSARDHANRLERDWGNSGNDLYGATYITDGNGHIVDENGNRHRSEVPYDAAGCVMTGREF